MKTTNPTTTVQAQPENGASTCQTKLHRYDFRLIDPEQAKAWTALQKKLKGRKCLEMCGDVNGPKSLPDGASETVEDVTIELRHIFNDQWNTTTDRVFDWYKFYEVRGMSRACGHWLEITDEMQAARMQTVSCGYCGTHYSRNVDQVSFNTLPFPPEPADGFCNACLDSAYLKETELHLLRLRPKSEDRGNHAPLTTEERETLLARYVDRQTTGADSRAVQRREKQRRDVIEESGKDIQNATTERDGKLWLWDHGVDLENVIYYSHTSKFSFGWRSPLSPSVKSKMLDVLSGFPFDYEFAKEK